MTANAQFVFAAWRYISADPTLPFSTADVGRNAGLSSAETTKVVEGLTAAHRIESLFEGFVRFTGGDGQYAQSIVHQVADSRFAWAERIATLPRPSRESLITLRDALVPEMGFCGEALRPLLAAAYARAVNGDSFTYRELAEAAQISVDVAKATGQVLSRPENGWMCGGATEEEGRLTEKGRKKAYGVWLRELALVDWTPRQLDLIEGLARMAESGRMSDLGFRPIAADADLRFLESKGILKFSTSGMRVQSNVVRLRDHINDRISSLTPLADLQEQKLKVRKESERLHRSQSGASSSKSWGVVSVEAGGQWMVVNLAKFDRSLKKASESGVFTFTTHPVVTWAGAAFFATVVGLMISSRTVPSAGVRDGQTSSTEHPTSQPASHGSAK